MLIDEVEGVTEYDPYVDATDVLGGVVMSKLPNSSAAEFSKAVSSFLMQTSLVQKEGPRNAYCLALPFNASTVGPDTSSVKSLRFEVEGCLSNDQQFQDFASRRVLKKRGRPAIIICVVS